MSYLSDYANNVSQILQHRGDAQAQAALNRGKIWGTALSQIGETIGGIPAARQLQKDNEQKRADQAQQRQLTGLQMQSAQGNIADAETKRKLEAEGRANTAAVLAIREKLKSRDPATREAVLAPLTPEQRIIAEQTINELDASNAEREKADIARAKLAANKALLMGGGYKEALFIAAMMGEDSMNALNNATVYGSRGVPEWLKKIATFGDKEEEYTLGYDQNRYKGSTLIASGPPKPEDHSAIYKEWKDALAAGWKGTLDQYQTLEANRHRSNSTTNINNGPATPEQAPDPVSASILAQTGLNMNAFYALTGQNALISRNGNARTQASKDAEVWARANDVDTSTLASQFKAYNRVLQSNIERMSYTQIMEGELTGTIENLQTVVKDQELGQLNFANVIKEWAGSETNDKLAQQYAFHLAQLQTDLTAYFAATQGRSGNNITLEDKHKAESVIKNGVAEGSLTGLLAAVNGSTEKMGIVMQGSVGRAQKAIWSLFGVGGNFPAKDGKTQIIVEAPDGTKHPFDTQALADEFKKRIGGIK